MTSSHSLAKGEWADFKTKFSNCNLRSKSDPVLFSKRWSDYASREERPKNCILQRKPDFERGEDAQYSEKGHMISGSFEKKHAFSRLSKRFCAFIPFVVL